MIGSTARMLMLIPIFFIIIPAIYLVLAVQSPFEMARGRMTKLYQWHVIVMGITFDDIKAYVSDTEKY